MCSPVVCHQRRRNTRLLNDMERGLEIAHSSSNAVAVCDMKTFSRQLDRMKENVMTRNLSKQLAKSAYLTGRKHHQASKNFGEQLHVHPFIPLIVFTAAIPGCARKVSVENLRKNCLRDEKINGVSGDANVHHIEHQCIIDMSYTRLTGEHSLHLYRIFFTPRFSVRVSSVVHFFFLTTTALKLTSERNSRSFYVEVLPWGNISVCLAPLA